MSSDVVPFDLREAFTFLFIMLGPIKLLGPFAKITAGRSEPERRALALRAFVIALLTVLAASFIGQSLLEKWAVGQGALAIAGGILFFLFALNLVLGPYSDTLAVTRPPAEKAPAAAVIQQLVPQIVTPWGIAAVIFILTFAPGQTLTIVAILIGIMLLDLLAMFVAPKILPYIAFPLQIVGTVMGVLQVALSIQIIVLGLKLVAVKTFGFHAP